MSPCDTFLVSGHSDGSIKVWAFSTIVDKKSKSSNTLLREIKGIHKSCITSLSFSRNDANCLLTNSRDHTLKIIDLRHDKQVKVFEDQDTYRNDESWGDNNLGIFSSGEQMVLVPSSNKCIIAFDIEEA